MNHRPKILLTQSDITFDLAYEVCAMGRTWDESLRNHHLSFLDLVEDHKAASLISGYTPLISRLCQEMNCSLFAFETKDEQMQSLLDQFRFTESLMKGLETM